MCCLPRTHFLYGSQLSDGLPTFGGTLDAAKRAANQGISIYTIGLGIPAGSAAEGLLQTIAGRDYGKGRYYSSPTSDQLKEIYNQINRDIRTCPEEQRAFVTVVQRPNPNLLAARGSLVTYTIVATNRDRGIAKNATITMPFNPAEVAVVDAKFSTPSAWVSSLGNNSLEMQTGELRSQSIVTATIRLRVLDEVPVGTSLGERLSYFWSDSQGSGSGTSNITVVGADTTSNHTQYYQIFVSPEAGPAGSTHTFATGVFAPNEPVALWYYGADGVTRPLEGMLADANGGMIMKYTTQGLTPGRYTMVAYGNWTGFTATGIFDVK
jgi:hypothetical protein